MSALTPEGPNKEEKPAKSPEEEAWLLSHIFFFWVQPLFRRARALRKEGKALEHDDLLPLMPQDRGDRVGTLFEETWAASAKASNAKDDARIDLNESTSTEYIRKAIFPVLGSRFIFAGLIKMCNSGLQFSFPLLLNEILKFIEDVQIGTIDDDDPWNVRYHGYWLSALLFLAMACKAVTENNYFHLVYRAAYQARVAVSVAVYNKALRLSNAARQGTTLGELINLMQVDATKIEMFIPQMHVLWDGLLQISGYMAILYTLIGWPCFVGLALMALAGPIQGVIMKRLFGFNRQMSKYTDSRVKITNEALQGIQSVKMFTWEESFEKEISKNRSYEIRFLRSIAFTRGFSRAYMSALPGLVAVLSFTVYAVAVDDSNIRASRLFAALVAFEQLRFPLLFYPMAFAQLALARVSGARVESFLSMREVGDGEATGGGTYSHDVAPADGTAGINVQNATIRWQDRVDDSAHGEGSVRTNNESDAEFLGATVHSRPILKDVTFKVEQGQLCAIVGRVASGKSTLCSALLNETLLDKGNIQLKGSVSYAAQSPWILNATLRDNILFGQPYDEERYRRVIEACQLIHDLKMLDNGDMTEIGEKGINLSGGQKQRVSVARAAYSNADVVILDDPLSALDPEVGAKMFQQCIAGFMKGKTIFFVTNQLNFLQFCDHVIALGKHRVVEQGSASDLLSKSGGEVKRLLDELRASQPSAEKGQGSGEPGPAGSDPEKGAQASPDDTPKEAKSNAVLLTKEERRVGAVSLSVYKEYVKAGGGYFRFMGVYAVMLLVTGNSLAVNSWVSYWTSDPLYEDNGKAFYLGIYFMFAVTLGFFSYASSYFMARFCVAAAGALHARLLKSVLSAPQSFFDTTPIGRILSRFSKDLYSIDVEIADQFNFFLSMTLSITSGLAAILFVTPWFGVAILPLGFLYIKILNYFRDVSRETKRLESISRSPVYAHFSETLGGLSTIRAYGESERFINEFEGKVDHNTRAYYCNKSADRWLSVRLELIGATIAGLAAVFASNVAISNSVSGQESSENFSSLAGLSLNYAISMTGMLNWAVRTFAQLEAGMNAVERVLYYAEEIPREAPRSSDELETLASSSDDSSSAGVSAIVATKACGGKAEHPPQEWPEQGGIILRNLKMRYRKDTPLVLKGLNVSISPGERVGVVGRTGSGKSSLLLTLLRLVEPVVDSQAPYEPPMVVDGKDTLRLGLKELRSKLGIIPQNPVLFSGTIRSNVDPFDDYSDQQIWTALEQCGMKMAVEEMPGMLNATVSEYGENMSAGSRQMLVLGRALLRQCKILLLDEATSSVDYETDREIQRTLREAFPGCTVITIAHRIDTIMDSDKILVMQDGLVAEFDSPGSLLEDPASAFSEIVRHSKNE